MYSRLKMTVSTSLVYVILIAIGLLMLLPFYWMFVLSSHSTATIIKFPPPFWFGTNTISNFFNTINMVNIGRSFMNSLLISTSFTMLTLLLCSMGGYAFALYDFPAKKTLFKILLLTMMVPWTATLVPWFYMMSKLGWVNNPLALIVPGCANAFGIFWMRQYCTNNVPRSLIDAAIIDGCSEWTVFFRIITPVLKPAFAALGIMQFVNAWNDFTAPLLILRKTQLHTLPLMLRYMQGDPMRGTDIGALMFASSMAVLPLLIAFLAASKLFMSGLTAGAIKE